MGNNMCIFRKNTLACCSPHWFFLVSGAKLLLALEKETKLKNQWSDGLDLRTRFCFLYDNYIVKSDCSLVTIAVYTKQPIC